MTKTPPTIEIVAELAQGFEGNPALAALLVKAAAAGGADAAKFQLVYADELATPDYKFYDLFKTLEMSDEVWAGLAQSARDAGIALYLDVFGQRSLDLAQAIGVETIKLHGTDISNLGFLADVAKSGVKRVMLGAGGAHAQEIEQALSVLADKQVIVLLGFQSYPTPTDTNQITRIRTLADRWASDTVTIGFADHADPEDISRVTLAATALGMGARFFEKHLTLGRNMKLEDHESALNPDEFAEFTRALRDAASSLGVTAEQPDFGMSQSEADYRKMIRRHVVVRRDILAGTVLSPDDLILKRSGIADFVADLDRAYGKTMTRALKANEPIRAEDIGE